MMLNLQIYAELNFKGLCKKDHALYIHAELKYAAQSHINWITSNLEINTKTGKTL